MDYSLYANIEPNIFPEIRKTFSITGEIKPVDFWAILTWKANRAKNTHRHRFNEKGLNFTEAVKEICKDIHESPSSKERLKILMKKWSFRLPTASAILSVLFPDEFTVYDIRVCNSINDHHKLSYRRFSDNLWHEYQSFIQAVINATPDFSSLQESDNYLWGKSWYMDSLVELELVI